MLRQALRKEFLRSPSAGVRGCWQGVLEGQRSAFSSGKGGVLELKSDAEYQREIASAADNEKLAVIDFTAKWCGPCRVFAPMFATLSERHPDVKFLKVDIDDDDLQKTSTENNITSIPTIVLVKDKKRVALIRGADVNGVADAIMEHKPR